jgi:alpha,alpha-trehalase
LFEKLKLTKEEVYNWEHISQKMRVDFLPDRIINQFEGYDQLLEIDLNEYRKKYPTLQHIDVILEREGIQIEETKVVKQADVLMLFYLFSADELIQIMNRLGYEFESSDIHKNIEYYLARTSNASTLSRIVSAWVLARSARSQSWSIFKEALESDVSDIQGGTTSEGIHLGAMGGTIDIIQRCYTGLVTRDNILWLNPQLPDVLESLQLNLTYRRHSITLDFSGDTLKITSMPAKLDPIQIGYIDQVYTLNPGQSLIFSLALAG